MALYDDHLREKVNKLPNNPGVYQYFDESGVIIYIGKAKNLKNRVLSYLNKSNQSNKTRILVNKIADLRYIVVYNQTLCTRWVRIFWALYFWKICSYSDFFD